MPRVSLPDLSACCLGAPESTESRSGRAAVLELPLAAGRRVSGSSDWVGGRRLGVPSAFDPWGSLDSTRCRLDFPLLVGKLSENCPHRWAKINTRGLSFC